MEEFKMAKVQPYKVSKEINGVTYTAQFTGSGQGLRAKDASNDDNGNLQTEKLAQYLLDHVIVEPTGLDVDDFESLDELNDVTNFASEVMSGKLKPEKEEKKATK